MLANFLEKSKPINFIVLLVLFFCLFTAVSVTFLFADGFNTTTLLKYFGYLSLFLVVFFFYNFIVSKNSLTFDNSYAYFIFTLFLSYFLASILAYDVILLFIFYILFLRKTYSFRSPKKILQKLFDSGFWLSILFILEPYTALFGVLIYGGIFLHQKNTINNLFAPVIGFLVPLIIYFTYCFWFDKTYVFLNLFYFDRFNGFVFFEENNLNLVVFSIIIFSFIAILLKSPKVLSIKNSFRRNWILIIVNLAISLFFMFLNPIKNGVELLFLIFPASIIIANGFEVIQSNLVKNLLFYLMLFSAILFTFVL